MLLSQAIYGFTIARTAEGYSSNTLDMYKWALQLLGNYLDDPDPAEVTYKELQSFFAYLATDYIPSRSNGDKSPLSRRSVENIWTAIRSFYNWAENELGIPSNDRPDIGLKRPRYAPSEIDPYTEDELKALNAFLTAEEAGFPRVKLESVCINIERLLSYSGKIRNRN